MSITYKNLTEAEITRPLFSSFHRHQEVARCWRKIQGRWVLKDIAFTEDWGESEYLYLVKCLKNTVSTGGYVFGAFHQNQLVGFSSVESELFGKKQEYVQLTCLHVSSEQRGLGIGRKLFYLACEGGRRLNAAKLYISSHSAEETQLFYHAMGCVETVEYNTILTEAEPCDCQLECVL